MKIWCKTGLSNSRRLQTTFKFLSRNVSCNSVHSNSGDNTWIVNRTVNKPYTCTLYIEDIRLSDSGEYYCEVKIASVRNPVISGPLHVEVVASENFNSNELILEITILAGALVLILLLIFILVFMVYNFVVAQRRRRLEGREAPAPAARPVPEEDPRHPLVQGKINLLKIYTG